MTPFRQVGRPSTVVCIVLTAFAVTLSSCGGGKSGVAKSGGGGTNAAVDINSFKFMPETIKVKAGGTVTWKNSDSAIHTAQADSGSAFDTGTLQKGASKQIKFATAGTVAYHCAFHPFMTGHVVVG